MPAALLLIMEQQVGIFKLKGEIVKATLYLFLFSIEILGQKIRANQDIKGFQLGSEELKILQYADDTSLDSRWAKIS